MNSFCIHSLTPQSRAKETRISREHSERQERFSILIGRMTATSRERIKTAATALFADKGYAATPTREICHRAGVTKPVLYYHFKSKENLYRVLVFEACSGLLRQLTEAAAQGATAKDRLASVLAADFALTKRDPRLSGMILRMLFATRREAPRIDFVETGEQWLRLMEGIVRDGVRNREMTCRPEEVATALLGIDMIYSISYLLRGEPDLDRRLANRIVTLLLSGCSKKLPVGRKRI